MDKRLDDPNQQWASLWAAKWLILAVAIAVSATSYVYFNRKPPVYVSSTSMLIGSSQVEEILRGDMTAGPDNMLANQAALLNSEEFYRAVLRRLQRTGASVPGFGVSVASGGDADVITVTANSNSPQGSADVANAYVEEYIARRTDTIRSAYKTAIQATRQQAEQVTGSNQDSARERASLLARVGELQTLASVADPKAQRLDSAQPAGFPVSPRPTRNAVFGFVLGLLLGIGVVFLRSRLDRRIRSLTEVEAIFGRPVLAAIPPLGRRARGAAGADAPNAAAREPLRRLLTTLELERGIDGRGAGTRTILVTSAEKDEGKSLVVSNLALVAREAGVNVAIVDADLHASTQTQLFSAQSVPGLTDVLAGRAAVGDAWQQVGATAWQPVGGEQGVLQEPNEHSAAIQVMAGGTRTPGGSVPLAGQAMESVLHSRDGEVDYVIVDAPPPLAVSDVLPLLSSVDAIVVVSRLGATNKPAARRLVELLGRNPSVPVVGVVANDVPEDESAAFGFVSAERYAR